MRCTRPRTSQSPPPNSNAPRSGSIKASSISGGASDFTSNVRYASSPSAVQQEPLLRVFAHPLLDHRGDGLHGALNVEAPVGMAQHREGVGDFAAKAAPAQTDHPHAVNRTVVMMSKACQQRVGLAPPAEKNHVDPFPIVLV